MGRYPTGPGQTRRPDRHRWLRVAPTTTLDTPALPERHDGGEWTAEALDAWSAWWASPMASAWIASDAVALRRAVALVDAGARGRRGTDGALLAILDRLGLTPAGRLRLQWQIGPQPVASPPSFDPAPRADDPRLTDGD
jgi:hypothetical protein